MIEIGPGPDDIGEWKARLAGDYCKDYLGVLGPATNAGNNERSLSSELANGRLAMAAINDGDDGDEDDHDDEDDEEDEEHDHEGEAPRLRSARLRTARSCWRPSLSP